MKMKKFILVIVLFFSAVLVSGCTQSASTEITPESAIQEELATDQPAVDSNQPASNPFQNTGRKCGKYERDGVVIEHCATCGDGVCDLNEGCVSSIVSCEPSGSCMATSDCGPLYCPEDCELEGSATGSVPVNEVKNLRREK